MLFLANQVLEGLKEAHIGGEEDTEGDPCLTSNMTYFASVARLIAEGCKPSTLGHLFVGQRLQGTQATFKKRVLPPHQARCDVTQGVPPLDIGNKEPGALEIVLHMLRCGIPAHAVSGKTSARPRHGMG